MLKDLNKRWQAAKRLTAAWKRWARKLPHNRVRRPILRDDHGRKCGYSPPVAIAEPDLDSLFCRKEVLPSGRTDVILSDNGVESAYRLARQPKPTKEEVSPLQIAEEEIRRLCAN